MKMICKQILSVFASLIFAANSVHFIYAEEEPADSPVLPSGLHVEQVEAALREYANHCKHTENVEYASAVIGIFSGNDVLYTGYFGETDFKTHTPANEESVYEWGSISKTLIWVSAMQLYEQGRLDLNRDVREYLPEGFFRHLSFDDPITMLNLMNHNAGWQETTRVCWSRDGDVIPSLKDGLQSLEPAQIHRPGEIAAYSNYGASVAGYVIECITGQSYCDYVHEHIFAPLGMSHTALAPDHSDNDWVYTRRRQMRSYKTGGMLMSYTDLGDCLYYDFAYPAGAATGTLADLMTYAQALADDSAPLFSSPDTQKLMFTATDCYGDSEIPTCAHGFWAEEYAVRVYGHSGGMPFGQANMLFDLESKTGMVVMINEPNGNWFFSSAPALIFGSLSPEKYADESAQNSRIGGHFLSSRSIFHGLLRFIPFLTETNIPYDLQQLPQNVYQLSVNDQTQIVGSREVSGIGTVYETASVEYIPDPAYFLHLGLFTLYFMLAVVSLHLLSIRRIMKKHGKSVSVLGGRTFAAGQIAQIISPLLLLVSVIIFAYNQGGISGFCAAAVGIAQMCCIAVCIFSAFYAFGSLLKDKSEKRRSIRFLAHGFGNLMTVCAIIFFEMYRFWGC